MEATLSAPEQRNTNSSLLDFMRSVAVMLVVVDHSALAFGTDKLGNVGVGLLGVTGVWMFFVHTSLVLMWSLERKPYTLDFYIRRIFRIYPLAIAATLAVVFFRAPLSVGTLPYFGTRPLTLHNLLANFFLTFNFGEFPNYFAILHVEWTLPWEMQMYLVLPALFLYANRERTQWSLMILWLLAVAVLRSNGIGVLSFAGSIPIFLSGVMSFIGFKRMKPKLPAAGFPVFLALLIVFAQVRKDNSTAYLVALILGLCLPMFRDFSLKPLQVVSEFIARYSFGIYLIHPFGLWIALELLGIHRVVPAVCVEMIVTFGVSVAAYHALEKPMIRLGAKLAGRVERRMLQSGQDRALSN